MKTFFFNIGTSFIKPFGCITLVLCSLVSHAQQNPLTAQYLFNPFIFNPAYAGFSRDLSVLATNRKQWAGFNGSPVTMTASGHIAMMENKMGLGLTILQDNIGINKTTEVLASYAYHIDLDMSSRLSFGLQAGVVNYRSDFNELTIIPGDPKFQNKISAAAPSIGAGIIYSSDKLFLSFSVPKLLEGKAKMNGNADVILYRQQFNGLGSYQFILTDRIKLKPFVMARYTAGAPISSDFGVALNTDKSYTLGLFTRNLHSFGAMMKINVGDLFRFGYIFELPTNNSVGFKNTAHEITIGIRTSLFIFHKLSSITDF